MRTSNRSDWAETLLVIQETFMIFPALTLLPSWFIPSRSRSGVSFFFRGGHFSDIIYGTRGRKRARGEIKY